MDTARLDSFLFEKMAESGLPGLSLALVRGDRTVHARGLGQRDLAHGLPATPDTLYSIGSVTKSFTALAIMQLAEQGLLDPSDPVERFLDFRIRPKGGQVTLEHLLTHCSGIPALAYSEALIGHANGGGGPWLPIAGPEDVLTFMDGAEEWAESRPGERWAYANEGFALLGLIIERVSGRPYDRYVEEQILLPLGMTRSHFARAAVEAEEDVAVPYVLPSKGEPLPGHYLYRRIRSEGGLISSATDLTRYLTMYLANGRLTDGRALLSESSLAEMTRPRIESPFRAAPELLGATDQPRPTQHYAFGLVVEEFLGSPLVSHGGSVLVSTAHLAFLQEHGLGVAVLANGSGYSLAQVARAALAIALGHDPAQLPAIRVQNSLDRLTGHYRSYRGTVSARIERHGDFVKLLIASRTNPEEVILVPETVAGDEPTFFTLSEGRRLPVRFRLGSAAADPASGPAVDRAIELLYERHKFRRTGPL